MLVARCAGRARAQAHGGHSDQQLPGHGRLLGQWCRQGEQVRMAWLCAVRSADVEGQRASLRPCVPLGG